MSSEKLGVIEGPETGGHGTEASFDSASRGCSGRFANRPYGKCVSFWA